MSIAIPDRASILTKALDFLTANQALMRDALWNLGEAVHEGTLTPEQFRRLALDEIRQGASAQFRFALGRKPDAEELSVLNALLESQANYLDGFVADIGAMGEDTGGVPARAALYAGSATQAAALGKLAGAPEGSVVTWTGPDGEVSCEDCLPLIGQSWRLSEFLDLGVHPGLTACDGNCRCALEVTRASGAKLALKAGDAPSGAMICLYLPVDARTALAPYVADPAIDPHVTLAYLGDAADLDTATRTDVLEGMARVANASRAISGKIAGIGRFPASASSDGKDVCVALVDVPGLAELRQRAIDALHIKAGALESTEHGFTPHVTLAYIAPGAPLPHRTIPPIPVAFRALSVAFAGERTDFPLAAPRRQVKYSPTEARVPRGDPEGGQWTAGGISTADISADEALAGRAFLEEPVQGKMNEDAERAFMKEKISNNLAELLSDDEEFAKFSMTDTDSYARQRLGLTPEQAASDERFQQIHAADNEKRARYISDQLRQWARTAADGDPESIAFQMNVAKQFGLKQHSTPWANRGGLPEDRDVRDEAKRQATDKEAAHRAIARAMYDYTQSEFKKAGITHVTVYRGMDFDKERPASLRDLPATGDIRNVRLQPLSSFATSPTIAGRTFGAGIGPTLPGVTPNGVTMAMHIPVSRVFSTTRTGNGALPEYEMVVLGGRGKAFFIPSRSIDWGDPPKPPNISWIQHFRQSRAVTDAEKDKEFEALAKAARARKAADPPDVDVDALDHNADWPKRTDDVRIFDLIAKRKAKRGVKYSPDQPRAPQGSEIGGEWISEGGWPGGGKAKSVEGLDDQFVKRRMDKIFGRQLTPEEEGWLDAAWEKVRRSREGAK